MPVDPHILNLYEALDLKLSDLIDISTGVLEGTLGPVYEKLDGQNLSFRVDPSGVVKFLGKGLPRWINEKGGLTAKELEVHFSDKPRVATSFSGAVQAMQQLVDKSIERFKPHFGKSMGAEVISPESPNVIRYFERSINLIGFVPSSDEDERWFETLDDELPQTFLGWKVQRVPKAVYVGHPDTTQRVLEMNSVLKRLFGRVRLPNPSVEDLGVTLLSDALHSEIPGLRPNAGYAFVERAAKRLLRDDSSLLKSKEFPSQSLWKRFKEIDDDRIVFVGDALAPLDRLVQHMGSYALDAYDFKVARDDVDAVNEQQAFVKAVRRALATGNLRGDILSIRRVASCLLRLDESLFGRNVEGIVFDRNNRRLKLVGAFAGLNRLRGYFRYGSNPLSIEYGR